MAAGVCVSGFISASVQFEAMRFLSAAKAQPFSALQPYPNPNPNPSPSPNPNPNPNPNPHQAQPFSALQPLFAGLFGYAALGEPP